MDKAMQELDKIVPDRTWNKIIQDIKQNKKKEDGYMNFQNIIDKIKETDGKIFNVKFYKKDGTVRSLTGRLGVKKGITGQGLKYDPAEKGLLTVYDIQNDGFRMINISGIISFTFDNIEYKTGLSA